MKVKSIKYIGKREVMDLSVENNHNYYLANGVLSHNSSIDPVQPEFESGLLDGEEPTGMNVVTLRPTFFKTIKPEKHKSNFWYSIDMRALTKADFMTMLNAKELTMTQQISLDVVFDRLKKRFEEDKDLKFSVELISEIIDDVEELSLMQKNSLKFKFKPLGYSHFFEAEYERNVVSLIKKNYIPALNLESFDSFGKGGFRFPETTLSVVLREIIDARREKKIKPVWIMIDEASRFLGARVKSSFKDFVLNCVEENTLIKTKDGDKKIKDLDENKDEILSWDFKNKKNIWSKFHKFGEDEKELFEVELENGKKIICSEDHRLFKMGNPHNRFLEKKLKELKVGDSIAYNNFLLSETITFSKIKSIKKIGKRKVYDLEVPEHHNFYLSNGILSHNSVDLDTRYDVNYCLEENTDIITNNGRKKIKDLNSEKDKVVSWNFKEDKYEYKKFKKYDTGEKKVVKIRFGRKETDFMATKDHTLFVWEDDKIIEKKVSELKVGDELVQYDDNLKRVKITNIEEVEDIKITYDLEVEDNHNFFIKNNILSHNCFASQVVEDVPDSILKQSKYIFIPATADVNSIKFVLINTGQVKNVQIAVNQSMRLKRLMAKHKYSWIVINRMANTMDLIMPLSPLSHHMTTGE